MTRELFLYGAEECKLCVQMKKDVMDLVKDHKVVLHVINIDDDYELQHRYAARIPVLVSGNREICELRLDSQALEAFLCDRQ